jgi:hypothetical protein
MDIIRNCTELTKEEKSNAIALINGEKLSIQTLKKVSLETFLDIIRSSIEIHASFLDQQETEGMES